MSEFKKAYSRICVNPPCKDCERRTMTCKFDGTCEDWKLYEHAKAEAYARKPWETYPTSAAKERRCRTLGKDRKRGRVTDT